MTVMGSILVAHHGSDSHLSVGRHPSALISFVQEGIHALEDALSDI